MALRYYANAAATTLTSSVTSGATTLPLASVTGLPIQYPFILIVDRGASTEEVVLVTNISGLNATVTRGYDSTTAFAHAVNAVVEHGISAIDPREANVHVNASSAVHGVAGTVVGTTDAQVLTNKDLSSATNTMPSSLATDAEVTSAVSTHAALTATHGATGAVVGTTNAQTLTNKTVALGSNTVSGTKAQFDTACTDADFATLAAAETLTNKTLTSPTLGGTATAATLNVTTDLQFNGASLTGVWTTFSPTITNMTVGASTATGRVKVIGKTVFFNATITLGAGFSFTGGSTSPGINLPFTNFVSKATLDVLLTDVSAGAAGNYPGVGIYTTTRADAQYGSSVITNTAPFTWAVGDTITISGIYEVS